MTDKKITCVFCKKDLLESNYKKHCASIAHKKKELSQPPLVVAEQPPAPKPKKSKTKAMPDVKAPDQPVITPKKVSKPKIKHNIILPKTDDISIQSKSDKAELTDLLKTTDDEKEPSPRKDKTKKLKIKKII
jgi:hypothetical protein